MRSEGLRSDFLGFFEPTFFAITLLSLPLLTVTFPLLPVEHDFDGDAREIDPSRDFCQRTGCDRCAGQRWR